MTTQQTTKRITPHIAEIISWKYGHVADTVDGKIIAWRHATIAQPDDVQIEADRQEYIEFLADNLYKEKREKDYPPIGDQLDAIWKMISDHLSGTIENTDEVEAMFEKIQDVKQKYPKPVKINPVKNKEINQS